MLLKFIYMHVCCSEQFLVFSMPTCSYIVHHGCILCLQSTPKIKVQKKKFFSVVIHKIAFQAALWESSVIMYASN